MIHNTNSSILNKEYTCKYSNIKPVTGKKEIHGYKLVFDKVENFYSIGTGLYRYKTGIVKRQGNTYYNLYKDTEYYIEEMVDKIAVFKTFEDVDKFYPNWKYDSDVSILEFTISGNLIELDAENKHADISVYAGTHINKINRIKN